MDLQSPGGTPEKANREIGNTNLKPEEVVIGNPNNGVFFESEEVVFGDTYEQTDPYDYRRKNVPEYYDEEDYPVPRRPWHPSPSSVYPNKFNNMQNEAEVPHVYREKLAAYFNMKPDYNKRNYKNHNNFIKHQAPRPSPHPAYAEKYKYAYQYIKKPVVEPDKLLIKLRLDTTSTTTTTTTLLLQPQRRQ